MTPLELCPICHIHQCDHISAQRSWLNPIRLHPTPVATELSILLAQLADRDRTIADYRKMLDMQAATIMRLSEIHERMNE